MSRYQGRRREDPDYGVGEHSIDVDELGLIDETELTERLVRAFEAPGYQPPRLPAVATELLALSRNPDVDFRDLEDLLERDAVLAGEVLALSRSAFYARKRPVGSLREALVLLGLDALRDVVFQAAMNLRVFRCASYKKHMENLRDHCRAVAHLSRFISRYSPVEEEQAFLCGLLHDVGIAGILLVLGDGDRGKEPPRLDALWSAIDAAHARAGARMVELWELPEEICSAVGAHHQVRVAGSNHPVAATVCVAESLAAKWGMGLEVDRTIDAVLPTVFDRAIETLGLGDAAMKLIHLAAVEWKEE